MNGELTIIPKPARALIKDGFFRCGGIPAVKSSGPFPRELEIFQEQLKRDYEACLVFSGETGFARGAKPETDGEKFVLCVKDANLKKENYRLDISETEIKVTAGDGAGAYHGLQSARQLFLSAFRERDGEGFHLPLAEIEDGPRFSWRGLMLDCSRNFFSAAFIKKLIDALSLHHISVFHWHLTDDQGWRFPVNGYPLLTEIGSKRYDSRRWRYVDGFYLKEEIRDIVSYAKERHIEIVPEVDLPGHASAILACYPGLGCTGGPYRVEERFGIFEDALCAGNDAIFDFTEKVFDTLAEIFPSPWVHIGGDEVLFNRWKECPKCQKRLAETGLESPAGLQSWLTAKYAAMLAGRGKKVIGWDEILENSKAAALPENAAIMSWRGMKGGLEAARKGHMVVMSSNTDGCYFDHKTRNDPDEPGNLGVSTISQTYLMDPAAPSMTEEEAAKILGAQANLWTELVYAGKIAEYMIFPRLCALAEAVWTPRKEKDLDGFARHLPIHQGRLDILGLNQYRGPLG